MVAEWVVGAEPVGSAESAGLLWRYIDEVVSRYHGVAATTEQVAAELAADPSDHLVPPSGAFLVARRAGVAVGCAGVVRDGPGVATVQRVFVVPEARGAGGGHALLAAVEAVARRWGVGAVRLDTRSDLVEAVGLYLARGYREVPAFGESLHSDRWFVKRWV